MDVHEAVAARRSVRGFLDRPVSADRIRPLLLAAQRAPSGGNLQPWNVAIVADETMVGLKSLMAETLRAGMSEPPAYSIYPAGLASPYRERRHQVGEALYARLGIAREDKAARLRWFARNFQFFDAPAAIFCTVDHQMGPPQWSDLGMFLQSFMLLCVADGLATCPQECWALWPKTIGAFINIPPAQMLFCGVAIGYEDVAAPANALTTERAPPEEWLRIVT